MTPEDILDANRLVLDEKLSDSEVQGEVERGAVIQGRVRIERGAVVRKGVTIRGPAHVGGGTTIEADTYIGPYTSIGSHCRLALCEIENSIIMDGCIVNARQRITDSLIGPETEILDRENALPKGHRLVLGERCRLIL